MQVTKTRATWAILWALCVTLAPQASLAQLPEGEATPIGLTGSQSYLPEAVYQYTMLDNGGLYVIGFNLVSGQAGPWSFLKGHPHPAAGPPVDLVSTRSHLAEVVYLHTILEDGCLYAVGFNLETGIPGEWYQLQTHPNPAAGAPVALATSESHLPEVLYIYCIFADGSLYGLGFNVQTGVAGDWFLLNTLSSTSTPIALRTSASHLIGAIYLYSILDDGRLYAIGFNLFSGQAGSWFQLKAHPDPAAGPPVDLIPSRSHLSYAIYLHTILEDGRLYAVGFNLETGVPGEWFQLQTHPNPAAGAPIALATSASQLPEEAIYLYCLVADASSPGTLYGLGFNFETGLAGEWFALEQLPSDVNHGDKRILSPAVPLHISPNPLRSGTVFHVRTAAPIRRAVLEVTDCTGRIVREIPLESASTGCITVEWDARDATGRPLSSGVFFFGVRGEGLRTPGRRVVVLR